MAAVALANKMARMARKIMVSGDVYRIQAMPPISAKMAYKLSQARGTTKQQPCYADVGTCKKTRRWCD
jgi:hypothetical protein